MDPEHVSVVAHMTNCNSIRVKCTRKDSAAATHFGLVSYNRQSYLNLQIANYIEFSTFLPQVVLSCIVLSIDKQGPSTKLRILSGGRRKQKERERVRKPSKLMEIQQRWA